MGLSGMAVGASRALEDIVAERILQQKLEQEVAERQQRMAMEQQRMDEGRRQFDVEAGQRNRQLDAQDSDRRARSNQTGVRRMLGEALTQGDGPMNSQDRRGLAALQVEAGDAPTLLNEPKPERDPIADHEAKARIDAKYRPRPQGATAERKPLMVKMPDGTVRDINGVLPDGAVPYDPVAARSSKPAIDDEAADTAREAGRLAGDLLKHEGFGGAFGTIDAMLPTLKPSTADAESIRDALTSMLTLENMSKMKGVLSDSDMKVLRQASTTLNARMSEGAARQELQRIVDVMQRVGGAAPQEQVQAADPVDALIQKYSRKPR
jgi:hypothetical protein